MEALKKYAKENYGISALILVELCFLFVVIFFSDKIYIAINDNLDSNIPLFKIFRDNQFWKDRTTPIPMLGGIDRSILTSGYSLNHLVYYVFDTKIAYWVNYIIALAFSGIGFFCLGNSIKKQTKITIDPNIFCIFGIFYIFLGMWPIAIISFSLIPWWAFFVVEIYRTKKLWLLVFFILLEKNLSAVLFGVFLLFYTVLFGVVVSIWKRKIDKTLVAMIGFVIISFVIINSNLLLSMMHSSAGTVKSLTASEGYVYNDGIRYCTKKFFNFLFIKSVSVYHSGVFPLKYVAAPSVFCFFILSLFEHKRMGEKKDFFIVIVLLMLAVVFNAFMIAFDHCARFRKLVPFLSGFNFERFLWLSPFFIILCFILLIHFLKDKKFNIIALVLLIVFPLSIILDFDHRDTGSMYNFLHTNYRKYLCHKSISLHARWNDYFAPELFSKIKTDINYNNEWCVAFGFEPSILQYNSIRTLDGYYSNYPTALKEKWEEMILPALEENMAAKKYWRKSYGIRCYLYAKEWVFPEYSLSPKKIGGVDLLIKPEILRDLGGKYIFSRFVIKNYKELGLEFINYWQDSRGIYDIGVYKIQ